MAIRNTYDPAGRLIKVETGELAGWQAEAVAPSAWTGFTVHRTVDTAYDLLGRKLRESLAGGGATHTLTQYSYDLAGRLECTAVRMNPAAFATLPASACTLGAQGSHGPDRITRNGYDAAGQLLKLTEAYGTADAADEATYSYTPNGKREFVIDAEGNKARFQYDGHDRPSHWWFPDKVTAGAVSTADYEQYGYDAAGNRTSLRKRDGQVIAYAYDALSRMAAKDLPGTAADVAYGYDLRGLQTSALFSASGQGIANAYDNAGRLTSSSSTMGGVGRTLAHQYDANGARTRLTYPEGAQYSFEHDGLNRLLGVFESAANGVAHFAYDAAGRRSSLAQAGWTTAQHGYDGAGRLAQLTTGFPNTGSNHSVTLAYNPASQIATRTASNDAYAWTGHRNTSTAYAKNGLNQYTSVAGVAHAYDLNGNLTSDGATTYAYDAENRLISASGAANASLGYDPLGRLWRVTGGGVTTDFLHDGDALVAEYQGGAPVRRYVHGPGVDEPLVEYTNAGLANRRHLYADERGSIVAVTDAIGGVAAINRYDEYGQPQDGVAGRFGYTGQAWIPELGLYHYKARAYSPPLGRFLQTDRVGYEGGMNLYAYADGDPIGLTDPTGELPLAIPILAGRCLINAGCRTLVATGFRVAGRQVAKVVGPLLSESNRPEQEEASKEEKRPIGELEPIHSQDANPDADKIRGLSDEELIDSIENPADGERIKVRGDKNRLLDGNTRIHEAKKRFDPKKEVTVEVLPKEKEFPK